MEQQLISLPIPIVIIKEEVEEPSETEDVHCRLCHKAFASTIALQNHARMDHIEAYETGDSSIWTKSPDDPVVRSKLDKKISKMQNTRSHSRKQEMVTFVTPDNTGQDANVSYIIVESGEIVEKPKKVTKREKEQVKAAAAKKAKIVESITGPFECVEPCATSLDGVCHRIFLTCCDYSRHGRAEHPRRHRAARCQVCERPIPAGTDDPHRPFGCESCGESFATADDLQDHTTKQHVKIKPYECGVCRKRFTQQGGVMQHMRMHTGDRPFSCTYCEKAFTQKSGLDQHLRTHTKEKPYSCVVCSKAFTQSVHLKQHMRTHTNVTPFQCGVCNKRFKQSSHLNYHLKNHNPAQMTSDQMRVTYPTLKQTAEQAPSEVEGNDVEIESQEMTMEMEQHLAEQSLTKEEYIISDNYGE